MGRKIGHLPDAKIDYILEKSHQILFISEILYSWAIFLSKMAVLTFYRRIFRLASIRIPIIVLMVCCACWITIRTFMTIFHCIPVQAYWDKSIDGRCLTNIGKYYLGTDLTHCLMDFIILALPLWEVVRMRLIFGQKIAVICIFSIGSVYVLILSQLLNASLTLIQSRNCLNISNCRSTTIHSQFQGIPFRVLLGHGMGQRRSSPGGLYQYVPLSSLKPIMLTLHRLSCSAPSDLPQIHPRTFLRPHNLPQQRPQPRQQHPHPHALYRDAKVSQPARHRAGYRGTTWV